MITSVRIWATNRPIAFVMILLAIYFVVLSAPLVFSSGAFGGDESKSPNSINLSHLPFELFLATSVVAVVSLVGWSKNARFTCAPDWSGIWAPIILTLYIGSILTPGLMVASGSGVDMGDVLASIPWGTFILFMLLIGVFEEGLFRGALLHGFEVRIGPVGALLVSSVLFGSMHFVNWITGQTLGPTIDQVLHAGTLGFLFGAIALRMNSIWFGVATHALFDSVVDFNGQILAAAAAIASADPSVAETATTVVPSSNDISLSDSLLRVVLGHFELAFGSIVLWSWWCRRNRQQD